MEEVLNGGRPKCLRTVNLLWMDNYFCPGQLAVFAEQLGMAGIVECGNSSGGSGRIVAWERRFKLLVPCDESHVIEGVYYGAFQVNGHFKVGVVLYENQRCTFSNR
jgi:hypothetical protein